MFYKLFLDLDVFLLKRFVRKSFLTKMIKLTVKFENDRSIFVLSIAGNMYMLTIITSARLKRLVH